MTCVIHKVGVEVAGFVFGVGEYIYEGTIYILKSVIIIE